MDGELDIVRSLEAEQHVQSCPTCSRELQNNQALRSTLTAGPLYYRAPAGLKKEVLGAIRETAKPERVPWLTSWRWLGVGASLAAAALLALIMVPVLNRPSSDDLLTNETIAAHVRSLMASHLTDVSSSDQHTVKPWFSGKLDFSPPVKDLTDHGFPLVGGRLDYLDDRPVVALVYRRQQHYINLFLWPTSLDVNQKTLTRHGYNLIHWSRSGMAYWVVSDLNAGELEDFVRLIQS
jgi:anti-sigma factor RsiW